MCVSLCTTVVHSTAQSSSDYLPSYPPDKHQSSDAVYWTGGGTYFPNRAPLRQNLALVDSNLKAGYSDF